MKAEGRFLRLLPFLVLFAGLAATWLVWRFADGAVEDRARLEFRLAVDETAAAIVGRLRAYELMLRGGAGLFFASDHVSRAEFRTYLEILQLQDDFPGIQGLGFAAIVPAADLAAHVARVREEGFPGYRVHPEGARDPYTAIVYLEPLDERNRRAIGYDMFAEPVRRAAMERARDTGDAAMSGMVRLVQEIDDKVQPGFLMYLPVYAGGRDPGDVEARRAALVGFIYAPFRATDLMHGILREVDAPVTFSLYDGTEPEAAALLYRDERSQHDGGRAVRRQLDIAGHQWTAVFAATPGFERRVRAGSETTTLAGAGIAISLVLFTIALLALRMIGERRRADRSIRAAEQKLLQSQKMEMIGQLTGGIAHDFNNLLTVVIGNAEALLARGDGDARARRLTEMTLQAARRGADLTSRLLAIARRQPLLPRPTDVAVLLSDLDGLLRRSLGRAVEIDLMAPPDLWPVLVDPAQLESALLNLAINARDAMPGGGRLCIAASNRRIGGQTDEAADGQTDLSPGDYVAIAVSDTGSGMDTETLARAFDPFFTTKPVGEGSGLGLSMVFGFARQSGGQAVIESEPGEGTRVTLFLPRSTEPAATGPAAPRVAAGTGAGDGARILLVEDEGLVREHAADRLRELGYAVTAVGTGPQALELLRTDAGFALLFTDLVMPGGLDGEQLASEAGRIRPELPVLLTTGQAGPQASVTLSEGAPRDLLRKPYGSEDLARAIRRLLDRSRQVIATEG